MVMGAPLEDAWHLAQRYDRMRQEAEAQVQVNVAAATEFAQGHIDEQTLAEVEEILKPVKNQTWPSGIQKS